MSASDGRGPPQPEREAAQESERLIAWLRLPAIALIAAGQQIADAVLACARGDNVVPPEIASGLVSEIRLRATNDAPALTERERQVLKSIAAGKSLPQIASELYLGVTTVKTHVQHLYEKLGVSDRAAAVAEGMRRGLIE